MGGRRSGRSLRERKNEGRRVRESTLKGKVREGILVEERRGEKF